MNSQCWIGPFGWIYHVHSRPVRSLSLIPKCLDIMVLQQVILTSWFHSRPSFHLTLKAADKQRFSHTLIATGYKAGDGNPNLETVFFRSCEVGSRCFVPSLVPLHPGQAQLDGDLGKLEGRSQPWARQSHHVPWTCSESYFCSCNNTF